VLWTQGCCRTADAIARQAQWELSIHLRLGLGTARDLQRALALAKASAEAGDVAGMNV
jgi:TPR repeat protein